MGETPDRPKQNTLWCYVERRQSCSQLIFKVAKFASRDHEKNSSDGQGVVKDRVKRSKCMRRRRRWWGAVSGEGGNGSNRTLTGDNERIASAVCGEEERRGASWLKKRPSGLLYLLWAS